jgi:hypothetical protein
LKKIHEPVFKFRAFPDDNYDQIGRWRFQIDRSGINDQFERGDLARLFNDRKGLKSHRRRGLK